jgi:hypothetical protein
LTFQVYFGYTFGQINTEEKAEMVRSKSMNFKEREIHRLKGFPKPSRLKVAPELLG